ncbi:MAG: thiamine phosphate synthase [Desulfobulbus propionicus]|nr:MAG: thiamine phosphate synthase [Desulfobulbus propionicus]
MMKADYTLYLVTDRELSRGRSLYEIVLEAIEGGVTCVQLREKHCSTREFLEQAHTLRPLLEKHQIPLIINDRIDIALAVNADGIHLGQKDMPLHLARTIAPEMIIGISAENTDDAIMAEREGADYIGISPVFATPTKTDTSTPLGLEGIAAIRKKVSLPIVGIGGINADNASQVIKAGADGIAVVSAIVSADSPRKAANRLLSLVQQ